jgi:hypothetical protein
MSRQVTLKCEKYHLHDWPDCFGNPSAKAVERERVINEAAQWLLDEMGHMGESSTCNLEQLVLDDMNVESWQVFDADGGEQLGSIYYERLNAIQMEVLLECLHRSVPFYGRPRESE